MTKQVSQPVSIRVDQAALEAEGTSWWLESAAARSSDHKHPPPFRLGHGGQIAGAC